MSTLGISHGGSRTTITGKECLDSILATENIFDSQPSASLDERNQLVEFWPGRFPGKRYSQRMEQLPTFALGRIFQTVNNDAVIVECKLSFALHLGSKPPNQVDGA